MVSDSVARRITAQVTREGDLWFIWCPEHEQASQSDVALGEEGIRVTVGDLLSCLDLPMSTVLDIEYFDDVIPGFEEWLNR